MTKPLCIATIRYTKQEVELHINALKFFLRDSNQYRGPYEKLLKDMVRIKEEMLEKENDAIINRDKEDQIVDASVCGVCD
mgnify:CR=1 FL=1